MSTNAIPTLHALCGKLASGKTTLARQISGTADAILFSEDLWLSRLFPGEIATFRDYITRSARLRTAIEPLVKSLINRGISIVLDFGGNAPQERAWVRSLCDAQEARLLLHYIRASDELCKDRLRRRNCERPEGSQVTTEAEFDEITRYFVPPLLDEGFEIKEYEANALRIN